MNNNHSSNSNSNDNDLFASKIEHMLYELNRLLLVAEKQLSLLPLPHQQQHKSLFHLLPSNHDIILVMRQIPLLINQSGQPHLLRLVIERVINQLYSTYAITTVNEEGGYSSNNQHVLSIEVYCRFLKILLELSPVLAKETENWLLYFDDERKNNALVTTVLIYYGLLPLEQLDVKLSKNLKERRHHYVDFIVALLRQVMLNWKITTMEEHVLVIHALMEQQEESAKRFITELKQQLTEQYRNENAFTFRLLFAEWLRVCRVNETPSIMYKQFAKRIMTAVYDDEGGKSENERQDRVCCFFRVCTEASIDLYEQQQHISGPSTVSSAGHTMTSPEIVDAYTKLVGIWLRSAAAIEKQQHPQQQSTRKLKRISNILSILILVLAHRHERQQLQFNQKPFLKLFSSIFVECLTATQHSKVEQLQFITLYSNVLYTLQPMQFPGFAFSWLQLFSHRFYLPLLFSLNSSNYKNGFDGQRICYKLMVAHLRFFRHILKTHNENKPPIQPLQLLQPTIFLSRFTQPEKAFYQGTLRFLVVILHDYPEFLCQHCFSLIRLLPLECIQLRNVILSAFPRTMILPDPFTTSLEYMKNITSSTTATISSSSIAMMQLYFDKDIDDILSEDDYTVDEEENGSAMEDDEEIYDVIRDYLTGKSTTSKAIGKQIMNYLMMPSRGGQQKTLHAAKLQKLIYFVGLHAPPLDTTKQPLSENFAIQIYKYMLLQLQPNSYHCYLMINYLIDHLRYPADDYHSRDGSSPFMTTSTYFFSITLLHLFSTSSSKVKEWITRVLLERLIVNRPHPWGLLTTFIQLIKEPMFLENDFIKRSIASSTDIKRLFENVLKSTRHY
ncbi:CCR4-Not complex component, Not1-domain-containing protein [Mycotypha africana]|uniref:CCR4-Not complex component, Not1-domain-containing protein n=1 Tax=Mycotypha africana TaxID=64632 RepID=UPI002300DAAD|nr:CCR4-Not complex component, Not1-domain-containing protein [Mycotypha africana]KAI8966968.1 CCR4-Not complex component, Not1-domain-containing protein [Mycotypha africana]